MQGADACKQQNMKHGCMQAAEMKHARSSRTMVAAELWKHASSRTEACKQQNCMEACKQQNYVEASKQQNYVEACKQQNYMEACKQQNYGSMQAAEPWIVAA